MSIRDEVRQLKRERILKAAEELFYERGFTATTLDAIAESLDMTKPFVYGAFDKKTDILVEIYMRIMRKTFDALKQAKRLDGSPTTRLRHFAELFTDVVIENQAGVAVFFREEAFIPPEHVQETNRLKSEFDAQLSELLEEGMAAKEFVIRDVRLAALAIGGMISWVYIWYREDGRLDSASIGNHMAEYALRIAGARSMA